MIEVERRICPHCGHESTEAEPVEDRLAYVGGRGMTAVTGCRDLVKCWGRWDAQHGLPTWDEQVRLDAAREGRYARNS